MSDWTRLQEPGAMISWTGASATLNKNWSAEGPALQTEEMNDLINDDILINGIDNRVWENSYRKEFLNRHSCYSKQNPEQYYFTSRQPRFDPS